MSKQITISARDEYNRQRAVATFIQKKRYNACACKYETVFSLLSKDGDVDFGSCATFLSIDSIVVNGLGLGRADYKWQIQN